MKNLSTAQQNSDMLVSLLQNRLQSNGKSKSIDPNGNVTYVDVDIFEKSVLESFIQLAISEFNQTPSYTNFTIEDTNFVLVFADVLIEGATLYALSSKALVERGREFAISDNGISFLPPSMAEMLNTQFSTLLSHHWDKVKYIKFNIKDFDKK